MEPLDLLDAAINCVTINAKVKEMREHPKSIRIINSLFHSRHSSRMNARTCRDVHSAQPKPK